MEMSIFMDTRSGMNRPRLRSPMECPDALDKLTGGEIAILSEAREIPGITRIWQYRPRPACSSGWAATHLP